MDVILILWQCTHPLVIFFTFLLLCLRVGTLTNHFDLVCGFVSGSKRDSEFLGPSLLTPKFRLYYRIGDLFREEPLQRDHTEMQCVSILSPTNTRFTTAMRALEVFLSLFVSFRVDFTLCVPAPFVSQKTKPLHSSAPPPRAATHPPLRHPPKLFIISYFLFLIFSVYFPNISQNFIVFHRAFVYN